MFSAVTKTTLILFLIACSQAQAFDLSQIKNAETLLLQQIQNPAISLTDKVSLIKKNKLAVDELLRDLINDESVDPRDLSNTQSHLAEAFQIADRLTILSQVQVEGSQVSEKSCATAEAMMLIAAADLNSETETPVDAHELKALQALCKR